MITKRLASPGLPGLAAGLLLAGCATQPKPLYYWGDYQLQLYGYFKNDEGGPQEQLAKLDVVAQEARAKGLPLPPGFNAHLGLLYAKAGQLGKAQAAFLAEEEAYPESKPYMDFLLKRKTVVAGPAPVVTRVTTTTKVTAVPAPKAVSTGTGKPVAAAATAAKPAAAGGATAAAKPMPSTTPTTPTAPVTPAPAPKAK